MLNILLYGVLAVVSAAVPAAECATASDAAAIEAYRRLPYCRLAPDGLHLAVEPCRRPPARSVAGRRSVPALATPAARLVAVPPALPFSLPAAAHSPPGPPAPAPPSPPAVRMPPVAPSALQPLHQCDIAGCRGVNGALYQQGAGNIVLDPSGRMCTRQGQWLQCL